LPASELGHWIEIAKNICEILAILGGAAWTYLNYFRGRIYKPRLECSVESSVEKRSGGFFLLTVARVRNIGLSKVPIEQKGTALLIFSADSQGDSPSFLRPVRWNDPLGAFDVFTGQRWVEPSESIAESLMVELPPSGAHTHKVALNVISGEIIWTAEIIVSDNGSDG
jgi:hypothetical protein